MKNYVDVLNRFIKKNYSSEGTFIFNVSYKTDNTFKSFRHYTFELYYSLNGRLLTVIRDTFSEKYTEETKDIADKNVNMYFLELLFDLTSSEEFKDIVHGRIDF